jgi:hypothetical protein
MMKSHINLDTKKLKYPEIDWSRDKTMGDTHGAPYVGAKMR